MAKTLADNPLPFFAPAGAPTVYFSVREGLTTDEALEGASLFLAGAGDLAMEAIGNNGTVEGQKWATVYLVEMAKALVDSAILEMDRARQARGVMTEDAEGAAQ
ncbi:hypothetical protein ACCAA_520027 [Candidatus Accumulibacter aalborgensis]|uniref:DUF3077 domain-containing protein n=1 Tax=Candidatus Accumulibacter aalborgensis TaxID=1860102 RepID=A0A1A8XSM2_9PROT|nr:DUF3077 domain-containing protein [Candidatus Accumulibacter aalborgensis]SBT08099.1 hypothetical protein ACCAA_520027 [Candidatus Accumulibacter aalborgensis]